MANELNEEWKRMVLNAAISSLNDAFWSMHRRHPEGNELPDYLDSLTTDRETICRILDDRNKELPWLLSTQLPVYPNFWVDLHRNVQYEKLPRSMRPPRDVT